MSKLEEMRIYVTLVELGSSTKTAEKLGLANSAISRRMKELESRLGVQLIQRTTRKMNVTADGEMFYAHCKRILQDIEEAETLVSGAAQHLIGNIRIAAPLSFGVGHLSSAIAAFMHQHPDVNIDIDMSDRRVDIIEEGFDVAIRIGKLEDSSLRARKLSPIRLIVCCSPSFLMQYGKIEHPDDLKSVPALCYSNPKQSERWYYTASNGQKGSVQVTPRMRSTNGDAIRECAIAGLGVVCEPTFITHNALRNKTLIPILTDYEWFDMNLYAVFPETRYVSARVRALIDFLVTRFGDNPYWDDCYKNHD